MTFPLPIDWQSKVEHDNPGLYERLYCPVEGTAAAEWFITSAGDIISGPAVLGLATASMRYANTLRHPTTRRVFASITPSREHMYALRNWATVFCSQHPSETFMQATIPDDDSDHYQIHVSKLVEYAAHLPKLVGEEEQLKSLFHLMQLAHRKYVELEMFGRTLQLPVKVEEAAAPRIPQGSDTGIQQPQIQTIQNAIQQIFHGGSASHPSSNLLLDPIVENSIQLGQQIGRQLIASLMNSPGERSSHGQGGNGQNGTPSQRESSSTSENRGEYLATVTAPLIGSLLQQISTSGATQSVNLDGDEMPE